MAMVPVESDVVAESVSNIHETTEGAVDLRAWGADENRLAEAEFGRLGRVVRVERGESDVITAAGPVRAQSDSQRSQSELAPATGDWVDLAPAEGGLLIERILPRRTTLARRDPGEQGVSQVLVTNVDTVFIVHGFDRPLAPGRLERCLVLVWASGAEPVVVLTKADLVGTSTISAIEADEVEATVTAIAPSVRMVRISARAGIDDAALKEWIRPGSTTALLGESGSGKSTLVNRLVGVEVQPTTEVRAKDRKGRHTTITRDLLLLPGGGLVIDTPGIRAVGLWGGEEALVEVFADIEELAGACRFVNCGHSNEPGCTVIAAIDSGRLDSRRLDRYRQMATEIAELEARDEARSRRRNHRSPNQ